MIFFSLRLSWPSTSACLFSLLNGRLLRTVRKITRKVTFIPMTEYDDVFLKFLIIGESSVGKSNLLIRYINDTFEDSFITTVGVDFKTKFLEIDNKHVKLQIWDTAGQEKFRAITNSYYRGAHGILLLFDLGNRSTFEQIASWVESIKDKADADTFIYLVGNKCDLEREVSKEEAEDLALQYGMKYYEASAKENINVDKVFNDLAHVAFHKFMDKLLTGQPSLQNMPVLNEPKENQKPQCCK